MGNALYSARHYVDVGKRLRETNANEESVNKWVTDFKNDNPRFSEARFREFVRSGQNKRSLK